MNILVLNAGSSSLKFGLFSLPDAAPSSGSSERAETAEPAESVLARGILEDIGSEKACIRFESTEAPDPIPVGAATAADAAKQILQSASAGKLTRDPAIKVDAIGCRVVHGGPDFTGPVRVTPSVVSTIRHLARFAPLHNPVDADVLEACRTALPDAPVVAVFDTAFHHTLPEVAYTYALPWQLAEPHKLRRYGFHGVSHRYVSEQLLRCLDRSAPGTRLITCHLGNGSSLCALRDGKSVDTSMGLTPLEGLVMGTRSGDVDPGLLLYLLQTAGMRAKELDDTLNHNSGLLGISGRSGDVRVLEQAIQTGDKRAELALDVFAYRVSKQIGAYAAALEGLDAVAFTGGIGEHAQKVRARICGKLAFLGIHLDGDLNADAVGKQPQQISAANAGVAVWVIPTDEERQIAREAGHLLRSVR